MRSGGHVLLAAWEDSDGLGFRVWGGLGFRVRHTTCNPRPLQFFPSAQLKKSEASRFLQTFGQRSLGL